MGKKTILYVDDESLNLLLFKMNFEKNYHVITCESGTEGLNILRNNEGIDIVISDMKMPRMNGVEFISQAHAIASHLRYYILTGFEISDEIQSALDSGQIRRYFQKPFNVNEIICEIEDNGN